MKKEVPLTEKEEFKKIVRKSKIQWLLSLVILIAVSFFTFSDIADIFTIKVSGWHFVMMFFEVILFLSALIFWLISSFEYTCELRRYDHKYNGLVIKGKF